MLINPQDFVLKEIPTYHPLSLDYVDFWRAEKQKCVEGAWLGGYYMPSGLYFYVNYGTILLNKKGSRNIKKAGKPWLRDLEWSFFRHWTEARGFSGFELDEEYTGCLAALDETKSDEYLKEEYPEIFNSKGERKEFITPRSLLSMQHPYHKGKALYSNNAHNLMMMGSRETGKALANDTLIPTPQGFKEIKDLKISDEVYSIDGNITKVLGVFPQGKRPIYKLTFRDGRTIEADEEHLWEMLIDKKQVTISTKELLRRYKAERKATYKNNKGVEYRCFLPKSSPVQYDEKNLPLDPYTLGVLIGDGFLTQQVGFSTDDEEILNYIPYECRKLQSKFAYSILGLNQTIKELKLNCKSEHKFIPEVYKTASVEQRYELVRGLMDTDGTVSKDGTVEFSTSSAQLADDFIFLCRSLGILCRKTVKATKKLDSYRVYVWTSEPIFKLRRKLARLAPKKSHTKVALIDVKLVGEKEATCIKVDHPSALFLATKDFIPTHNTYMVGVGVVLHQWLFNGATSYDEYSIKNPHTITITVGAELAHYSNNMLVKTKFAYDNLPGSQISNGRKYPSPFWQPYKGSWNAGSSIIQEYKIKYPGGWSDEGSKSMIDHRTFRDNPYAAQGTRPLAIILEEIGMFSNLKEVYTNTKDNLRDGLAKTGTLMMLGTGGDMDSGTLDAAEMFYDPIAYQILPFEDTWEHRGNIGFFVPAYLALNAFKDERGFSNEEAAKQELLKERNKARQGKGGSEALNKEIQYRPLVPSEMFLSRQSNIFPTTELRRRLSEVQSTKVTEFLEKKVELYFDPTSKLNGVGYSINDSLTAINQFPWKQDNVEGAVVIYDFPYTVDGIVPPDAYIIGCDPFRDNVKGVSGSFAAIYVMKTNKYPSTVGHNEIVASYIGRPYSGVNEVNETLYKLSLFYGNAKIYFENAVGNIKDYFDKIKRLDLLARQPTTVLNRKASYDTVQQNIYGYPMSNDKIKWEALQYVRTWLMQERGNNKRNLDLIPDQFLLQQLISFNLDGNFDAVMGLIGCVIGLEEVHNTFKKKPQEEDQQTIEFNKILVNNSRLFKQNNEKLSETKIALPW